MARKKTKARTKAKAVPKREGSMAEFVDDLLLEGGPLDKIAEKCKAEAEKRGAKTLATKGQVRAHLKFRIGRGMAIAFEEKKEVVAAK